MTQHKYENVKPSTTEFHEINCSNHPEGVECGIFLETFVVLNHWQMLNNVHSERMKLRLQQVMAVAISDSSLVERP